MQKKVLAAEKKRQALKKRVKDLEENQEKIKKDLEMNAQQATEEKMKVTEEAKTHADDQRVWKLTSGKQSKPWKK
jgi:hypothetical protein